MAATFEEAGHLPNRRGGVPPDPEGLPRQRRGTTPQMHGRYPDYDVLEHAEEWDEVTRELIVQRARDVPPIRFFTPVEARTLRAFCDVVMAQDREPRVPVLEMVDKKLHEAKLDGYQYADMPDDRETWRIVARELGEASFADLDPDAQHDLVDRFSQGELDWPINVSSAWSVVMRAVLSEFYSHPWAWNEIGFGGPRYPRGYMRQGIGPAGADPNEAVEAFHLDPVKDTEERGLK